MRVNDDQLAQQQLDAISTLKAIATHLARDSSLPLTEDTRRVMRELSRWLEERAERHNSRFTFHTKASLTRSRLFCLQLERLLEQLEESDDPAKQRWLCDECGELVAGQQQRYLYENMIGCLRELSSESVDRGLGQEAVMYNDLASRLETRLECGHIDLHDETQRAKDEALYAEFRQKLEALRP